MDKHGALQRLHAAIERLLDESRVQTLRDEEEKRATTSNIDSRKAELPASGDEDQNEMSQMGTHSPTILNVPQEDLPTSAIAGTYQTADFSNFFAIISAERFYQEGYDSILTVLIAHVIEQESPILEELLVHRIARAHGFQKSGRLIRERVVALAETNHHAKHEPSGGRFFWPDRESPLKWNQYRIPASNDHFRKIEEIPLAELRAASLASSGPDLPVEIARLFGILRLAAGGRARLEGMLGTTSDSKDDCPAPDANL